MGTLQKIEKLKSDLIFLLNHCQIDIATAYYVFKDVFNELEKEYLRQLKLEQETINKEKQQNETQEAVKE